MFCLYRRKIRSVISTIIIIIIIMISYFYEGYSKVLHISPLSCQCIKYVTLWSQQLLFLSILVLFKVLRQWWLWVITNNKWVKIRFRSLFPVPLSDLLVQKWLLVCRNNQLHFCIVNQQYFSCWTALVMSVLYPLNLYIDIPTQCMKCDPSNLLD